MSMKRVFKVSWAVIGFIAACLISVFFISGLASSIAKADANQLRVEFSRIGDASHFEFEGPGADRYKIERLSSGEILLRVPALDEASLRRLKSMSDGQVEVKSIDGKGVDGTVEVKFVASKGVDYFDYISDQPSRLVLDFFPAQDAPKDAKPLATANADDPDVVAAGKQPAMQPAKQPATLPAATTAAKGPKAVRNPAGGDFVIVAKQGPTGATTLSAEPVPLADQIAARKDFERGIFDGGDPEFSRFTVKDYEIRESARMKSRAALRIPFPMLDLGFPKLAELQKAPAIYEIIPGDTTENKEARLLLTLFKNDRQGLFLATAKEFLRKYPQTKYDEIIRYAMADTHYSLWVKERQFNEENKIKSESNLHDTDFEEAMGIYNNLVEKYPDSPMTTRTLLLVGYSYLERGDSFGALKTFQRFVRLKPESKYAGQVKISIARAFLSLNRWEDAISELASVEKSAKSIKDRQEASYRQGDVYFRKGDFGKAISVYDAAIKKYPEATGRFPNAFYNLAESRFRLGEERAAIDSFRQFLQKFPDHDHGGFAMTRLGELIEILVGAEDRRVTGAFFESYFRFRSTPGADVARMRVLTARMSKMKDRELKDALLEIDEIVERDADLPFIKEFQVISVADAFTERKEYDRATKDLVQFYKENTQSKHLPLLKGRIVRNLADSIRNSVEDGDFIQGLRLYSRDQSGWLKGVKRADLPYLAGRAFESAGVFSDASHNYKETLQRLDAQTPDQRDVFETPISKESVRLRLAAMAAQQKDYAGAESQLKQIKDLKVLSSSERAERAGLAADVSEARGQAEEARKYLAEVIKSFEDSKAAASSIVPLHLRVAKLAVKDRDFKTAEASVEAAMKMIDADKGIEGAPKDVSLAAEKHRASALESRAEIMIARGKKREAVGSYQALLELPIANADATRKGYDSVRYRLGQLLFETGDLKGAEKTWAGLAADEKNLWKRLAAEQMTGAKWREEYKKYIERIPAAAEIR
ncbi:MAG: tetratricopeptide repeat protein [Deltaproteobacteria bacterium]|nr:tetratricopeptide repeat protein [Deltaproteobacteria bacterium]